MWAMIDAYIDYGEDEMTEEEREAFREYGGGDDRDLMRKIDSKMSEICDQFIDLGLDYDTDLYGDEDDPGWIAIHFDDNVSEDRAKEVIEIIKKQLDGISSDFQELEYYGRQISGGYPSYDPPEYESLSLMYYACLVIGDNVKFEVE